MELHFLFQILNKSGKISILYTSFGTKLNRDLSYVWPKIAQAKKARKESESDSEEDEGMMIIL